MHRLILALCLLAVGLTSAEARRFETTYVTVTDARAVADNRSVAVELTVDTRSWTWMRERGIVPTLRVWIDGRPTDVELRASHDTIVVPLRGKRRELTELRIALGGRGPRNVVGSMLIGGIEVVEVTLKVARGAVVSNDGPPPPSPPPPPPPLPTWSANPSVIKACGDTMIGSANQEACLDAIRTYASPPEPMVRACARAMTGSTSTLSCIRSGAASRSSAVNALDACGKAMTGSSNTLACLDTALRSFLEPSAMIAACAKAMTGSTNTLACLGLAVEARTDPTPTIASCSDAMTGDSAVLGCLQRALVPR